MMLFRCNILFLVIFVETSTAYVLPTHPIKSHDSFSKSTIPLGAATTSSSTSTSKNEDDNTFYEDELEKFQNRAAIAEDLLREHLVPERDLLKAKVKILETNILKLKENQDDEAKKIQSQLADKKIQSQQQQDHIQQLQLELKQAEKEYDETSQALDQLERKQFQKEAGWNIYKQELKANITNLMQQLDQQKEEYEMYMGKLLAEQERLQSNYQQSFQLKETNAKLETKLNETLLELEHTQHKLERAKASQEYQGRRLNVDRSKLQQEVAYESEQIERLQTILNETKAELERTQHKFERAKESQESQGRRLNIERSKLQQEVAYEKEQLEQLQQALNETKAELESTKHKFQRAKESQELQGRRLNTERSKLQQEVAYESEQLFLLQQTLNETKAELERTQHKFERAKESQESQGRRLNIERSKLQQEVAYEKEQLEQLQQALNETKAELESTKHKFQRAKESQELQGRRLNTERSKLQQEVAYESEQLLLLQQTLNETKAELKSTKKKLKRAKESQESKNRLLNMERSKLQQQEQEVEYENKVIQQLQHDLQQQKDALNKVMSEKDELKEQLLQAKNEQTTQIQEAIAISSSAAAAAERREAQVQKENIDLQSKLLDAKTAVQQKEQEQVNIRNDYEELKTQFQSLQQEMEVLRKDQSKAPITATATAPQSEGEKVGSSSLFKKDDEKIRGIQKEESESSAVAAVAVAVADSTVPEVSIETSDSDLQNKLPRLQEKTTLKALKQKASQSNGSGEQKTRRLAVSPFRKNDAAFVAQAKVATKTSEHHRDEKAKAEEVRDIDGKPKESNDDVFDTIVAMDSDPIVGAKTKSTDDETTAADTISSSAQKIDVPVQKAAVKAHPDSTYSDGEASNLNKPRRLERLRRFFRKLRPTRVVEVKWTPPQVDDQ